MVNVEGSLSADLIAQQNFGAARRGFDPDEVRAFLVKVAAEIVALHERQTALEIARRDAEYRAAHPSFDEETLLGAVGDETAQILKSAHEASGDIKSRAEENAARILKEAHQQAEALRGEAESVLSRRTEEAEGIAARIRETARAEAERLVDQARQQSKAIRAQAEAERNAMVEGAQATRERILSALSKKRNVAVAQVEQLRAGRERLLEAYQVVRRTLDEVTGELARAEVEARAAADAIRHRPLTLDEPDGLEEEGGDPTNPTLHIVQKRLRPASGDPTTPPPAPSAASAAAPVPAPAPHGAHSAAGGATEALPRRPAPAQAKAQIAPSPAPSTKPSPPRSDATKSATAAPAGTAASAAPSAAPAAVAASKTQTAAGVAPPTPPAPAAPAAAPPPDAAASAAPAPAPPPDTDTVPTASAPAAPASTTATTAAPEPTTAAPFSQDPTTPAEPKATPPPSSEPVRPTAETPPQSKPPAAEKVESLFARIRADRDRAVAHAREVLADDPADDPAERPVPDADETLLQRRDEVVGPIEANLSRRLKRALQDDQNDLLDRLRGLRASQKAVAVVLPALNAHAARFRDACRPFLAEAINAGGTFVASLLPGVRPTEHLAGLDHAADQLAEAIVEPLRRRLETVLVAGEGDDPVILAEAVGGAYREWKTKRVEVVAADHVAAAFASGAYAATPSGTQLRWLVEDTDGPCPDCDDNVLAGEQAKGEPFPTGQKHPPAHAGCRCLLVPQRR